MGMLVVIGNPYLLSQHTWWRHLLQYAVSEGCYVGCPLPPQMLQHASNESNSASSGAALVESDAESAELPELDMLAELALLQHTDSLETSLAAGDKPGPDED